MLFEMFFRKEASFEDENPMKIHGICFAKNEADIIAQTLSRAAAWCDYIYVVDNNSCDRTWEIVLELAQQHAQIIPFRQEYRPFYDGMRGEVFHAFRDRAQPGDWWCRIDADEFYIDNPRVFLSNVPSQYQAVWAASFQYYFTDKDLALYERHPEAFADDVPAEKKCRYYRNDWSENRFFRYDRKMVWDSKNKSRSWPYFGAVYPKRIRLKHFQYRSPQQIQARLLTRFETWSANRTIPIFFHEAQLAAGKENNLWRKRVVKASDLTFDHLDNQYIMRDDLMPPVPRAYFPRIVNRFRYLKKHINKTTLNKRFFPFCYFAFCYFIFYHFTMPCATLLYATCSLSSYRHLRNVAAA